MPFATKILGNALVSASARQQALDRIYSDPGIPQTPTTSSFWTRKPQSFSPQPARPMPKETDVVIIGSGIAGASIVRSLLKSIAKQSYTPDPSVVMLEARTVCSGATGRNGGHILETADEYSDFADVFSTEGARKLLQFRLAHLPEMLAVADELGITTETQARKVKFLSVYFSDEVWKEALARMRRFKEDMPDEAAEWTAYEGDTIPTEFHLSRARGVITGPAGALWPYKFVTGVLRRLLADFPDNLRIEENTAVTAIHNDLTSANKPRYKVETTNGIIIARHVIHCTNAHVSHLVPGLRGRVFPVRGQMSAQTPGDNFPNQASKHSWVFNYDRGFDYMTQLSTGQMMLGGGFAQSESGGLADLGVATDSELSLCIDIHLSGALRAIFGQDWGHVRGDPVQAMWTGSMAFSSDGFPWVGRLPGTVTGRPEHGSEGAEWVCAAFGGEGMVQAWLSGKAIASMLLAQDASLSGTLSAALSWFPEQLLVTEERLARDALPMKLCDELGKASL